ncbi:MAG: ZIP family metal transporter [Prevotella sp.]
MSQIWISAAGLAGSIFMGSLLGFFIKELPHKWNDAILGYCAGIMLAASMLGLIVNAFNMTTSLPWWMIAVGVMLGALFLNVLDLITPHLHHITGLDEEEHLNNKSLDKILLFVMAIALHKMPEGMAAGVSMSTVETDWSVSVGIALQNIPEGMVIIAPLLMAGVSKMRTVVISLVIGLLEVIGVWVGFGMGSLSEMFLPVMLGFAGGAMLYVTSDELIPETHAHGYQKQATYALLLGVITFIAMEKYV